MFHSQCLDSGDNRTWKFFASCNENHRQCNYFPKYQFFKVGNRRRYTVLHGHPLTNFTRNQSHAGIPQYILNPIRQVSCFQTFAFKSLARNSQPFEFLPPKKLVRHMSNDDRRPPCKKCRLRCASAAVMNNHFASWKRLTVWNPYRHKYLIVRRKSFNFVCRNLKNRSATNPFYSLPPDSQCFTDVRIAIGH